MPVLLPYLAPVVSALVVGGVLFGLLRHRRVPLDHPNERSLHTTPVPRIGGLALMPAMACGWALVPDAVPWSVWLPAAMVFAVSCVDDLTGLSAALRLIVHLVAAAIAASALVYANFGLVATLVAIVAIAWMTNLFNFMDGSDGLAGGMALFGFGAYALAAGIGGNVAFAITCAVVSSAAATFLYFNFHPARVFMGDAGSIPLGFLAGALGLLGWVEGLWPLWFPFVVFSAFVIDATVTLLRRVLRGEKIWHAHRQHYYQRLVRHGWGHRRTALTEYALMIACALLAVLAAHSGPLLQGTLLAVAGIGYCFLMVWVDRNCHVHDGNT